MYCVRVIVSMVFCFFFKQKTAYEMRISDWSSDVCSSDLGRGGVRPHGPVARHGPLRGLPLLEDAPAGVRRLVDPGRRAARHHRRGRGRLCRRRRSEEHTSELQSLMRISYAVFCLKKKNNTHTDNETNKR